MRSLAFLVLLAACEKAVTPTTPPVVAAPPPADARTEAGEVEAAMTEFLAYSESVLAIMRAHGKDCDEAARLLEPRAAVFAELGPRMMKLKERLAALPAAERERIKRASDQQMEGVKARNPDADEIEAMAKACDASSPAFAAISPKVMFVKKH